MALRSSRTRFLRVGTGRRSTITVGTRLSYVLAGELTFQLADQFVTKGAGEGRVRSRGECTTPSPTSAKLPRHIWSCVLRPDSSGISTQTELGLPTTSRRGLPWVRHRTRARRDESGADMNDSRHIDSRQQH